MGNRNRLNHTLTGVALALCFCGAAAAECSDDHVNVRGTFGEARFSVSVADDDQERSQGLMHVDSMPRSSGMLFVFDRPRPVAFWMKNTLIPLDMIFTDVSGRIQHIHHNAIPHDETPIPGGEGVFTVLEINGGLADAFGMKVGDALQHPVFDASVAAIPCSQS